MGFTNLRVRIRKFPVDPHTYRKIGDGAYNVYRGQRKTDQTLVGQVQRVYIPGERVDGWWMPTGGYGNKFRTRREAAEFLSHLPKGVKS